jgi:MarR family transcriptional regulator, organic hydroperoxide resistance regulator
MSNSIKITNSEEFKPWWLLHQVRDVTYRVRGRELNKYGITFEQSAVLYILKILNKLKRKPTPGEIAKGILKEPDAVSKILTRMEKQGLLSKHRGLGKKNEVYIALTKKGEQAYIDTLERESIRKILNCLSKEEEQQLILILEKLKIRAIQELSQGNDSFFP